MQVRSDTLSPESNLTERTMSKNDRSSSQSHQPQYAKPSGSTRAVIALASVLVSSTLLGGMLGLFEMQSASAGLGRAEHQTLTASASAVPGGRVGEHG